MQCSKCGKELKKGQKFCIYCGEKIPDSVQEKSMSEIKQPDIPDIEGKTDTATNDSGIGDVTAAPVQQMSTDINSDKAPTEPEHNGKAEAQFTPQQSVNNTAVTTLQAKQLSPNKKSGVLIICLLQVLVALALAALIALFPFWGKAVSLDIASEDPIIKEYSFMHIINSLISGSDRYNPSVLSVAMGTGTLIFVFSSSVFWLITAVSALIRKGYNGMRRISIILTFFAIGFLCSIPFIAEKFMPQFKLIYAREAGVLVEEMKGLTSLLSYVWATIILLLIIITWVLVIVRKKRERAGKNNEK